MMGMRAFITAPDSTTKANATAAAVAPTAGDVLTQMSTSTASPSTRAGRSEKMARYRNWFEARRPLSRARRAKPLLPSSCPPEAAAMADRGAAGRAPLLDEAVPSPRCAELTSAQAKASSGKPSAQIVVAGERINSDTSCTNPAARREPP